MFDKLKYDSDGTKYRKQEFDPGGNLLNDETCFGNLVLRNGRPFRILHDDGYVNLPENGLVGELNFHVKDHLGNVRAVLSETPDRQPIIVQASGYYPFGMLFQSEQMQTSASANANKYLYNGKEVQDMPGKWYDYGARFYDAGLGRWFVVDAMAENHFDFAPYNYALNNPLLYIDPIGMDTVNVNSDTPDKKDDRSKSKASVDEAEKNPNDNNSENKDEVETSEEVNKNPAKEVFEGGMTIALTLCFADGPEPGPGDAAGLSYAASTAVTAGLVWLGWELYQFAQHGTNRGVLEPEEHKKLEAKEKAGTITGKEKLKLKKHRKNIGKRPSRQSKDKKR